MSSYSELMAQAKKLMQQAEDARRAEMASAVAEIKALMMKHGLTVSDLGGTARSTTKTPKTKAPAKYRGPEGQLWSGGPGRKPEWVRAVLAAGGSIEQFKI